MTTVAEVNAAISEAEKNLAMYMEMEKMAFLGLHRTDLEIESGHLHGKTFRTPEEKSEYTARILSLARDEEQTALYKVKTCLLQCKKLSQIREKMQRIK